MILEQQPFKQLVSPAVAPTTRYCKSTQQTLKTPILRHLQRPMYFGNYEQPKSPNVCLISGKRLNQMRLLEAVSASALNVTVKDWWEHQ